MPKNALFVPLMALALPFGAIAGSTGTAHASAPHTFSPAINGQEEVSISTRYTDKNDTVGGERPIMTSGGNGQYVITIPSRKHPAAEIGRSADRTPLSDKRSE